MSAIEAALDRGRSAAPKRGTKWEPAGVEFRGRLIAVLENTDTGAMERVYQFRGKYLFFELGHLPDGTATVHPVRDRALRKMAHAMVGGEKHRDALIEETWRAMQERTATRSPSRRIRRGKG